MAVRIRMKQMGRKHRHYYRIVATDHEQARDGRVLEELGTYDPQIKNVDETCTLLPDRIDYWVSVGARPSDRVTALLKRFMERERQKAAERAAAQSAPPAEAQAPAQG